MKRIHKSDFDQFYTKEDISKYLINKIELEKYKLIIDPCVGWGSFYNNINHSNKIGFDIDPKIDVEKVDFLNWNYEGNINNEDIIFITNPPFGKQGSLAMKFINHASNFSNTIAYILPKSFQKGSVQNRINKWFHLEKEENLPKNSFILDNNEYDVPSVFQIWKRKNYKRENYKQIKPIGFKYVKKENNPDISIRRVGVYAGTAFKDINKSDQSHYFIKFNKIIDLDKIINKINNIKWIDKTTGPRSIAKTELTPKINKFLNSHY